MMFVPKNTLKWEKNTTFPKKQKQESTIQKMMVQVLRFDSNPGLLTGAKTWQGGLAWFQERLPTTKKNWVVVLSIFYFHPYLRR